jgi:shikimate kinase
VFGALPPFLAVEGNSGVGKSVTARALAARLDTDWFPEAGSYVDATRGERVPSFPGRDDGTATRECGVWTAVELRRQEHRLHTAAGRRRIQVVDCTPVSVLAFEVGKARFGLPNALRSLASSYLELAEARRLQEPCLWVFLTAPPAVVLERIRRRGGSRPFLKQAATVDYLDRVRTLFAAEFVPRSRFLWLDTSAASLEEVVDAVTSRLGRVAGAPPPNATRALFRSLAHDQAFVERALSLD